MGYYGPKYVWILLGYALPSIILQWEGASRCTPEQIMEASDGYLTLQHSYYTNSTNPTISNLVSSYEAVERLRLN